MNIKDVGPDLRCKGQMVAPVHLNTASALILRQFNTCMFAETVKSINDYKDISISFTGKKLTSSAIQN